MSWWRECWLLVVLGAVIVAILALCITASIYDERAWTAFASRHECRVVGRMTGDIAVTVAPIIGGNGGVAVGVNSTPDKTGYLCNDGVTYWR